jgi:hypothetical protein
MVAQLQQAGHGRSLNRFSVLMVMQNRNKKPLFKSGRLMSSG